METGEKVNGPEEAAHTHVVTVSNWRQYAGVLNVKLMEKADIPLGSFEAATFYALALGGEMGELQNIVKKMWRDGQSEELFFEMTKEIADVLIYMDHFLEVFKLQASAVIVNKVQELVGRYPEYFADFKPQKAN